MSIQKPSISSPVSKAIDDLKTALTIAVTAMSIPTMIYRSIRTNMCQVCFA